MTLNTMISIATMPPARIAAGDDVAYALGSTTLGHVLVARSPKGICAILIGNDRELLKDELQELFPGASPSESEGREETIEQVIALIEKPAEPFGLPLDLDGSDFEIKVWQALRDIPAGTTLSYSALAEKIGLKNGARDVAEAVAANHIAVAVPCHRIVRKDGSISGYRWGVYRKRTLLKREGAL